MDAVAAALAGERVMTVAVASHRSDVPLVDPARVYARMGTHGAGTPPPGMPYTPRQSCAIVEGVSVAIEPYAPAVQRRRARAIGP